MKFGDFKNLNYPDDLPMEYALISAMFEGKISMIEITNAYTKALEKERRLSSMKFEEACLNIFSLLSIGKKEEDIKRAIHTFNLSKTLGKHSLDKKFKYTEEDEKMWDKLCLNIYRTSKFEEEGE